MNITRKYMRIIINCDIIFHWKQIQNHSSYLNWNWMHNFESYDIFSSWFSISFIGEVFKLKFKLWFSCCHCTLMKAKETSMNRWYLCNRSNTVWGRKLEWTYVFNSSYFIFSRLPKWPKTKSEVCVLKYFLSK